MKIVFASSECKPFIKTGGLGDVVGTLPKILKKNSNLDVRIIIPLHKKIDEEKFKIKTIVTGLFVTVGNHKEFFSVKSSVTDDNVPVYFIENKKYFHRDEVYGTKYGAYLDNAERFIFFSKAVLETLKAISFKPDVIHSNDWPTALIPVYLKTVYACDMFFANTKSVFTIHNIQHQGIFPSDVLQLAGISWEEFTMDKLEYFGNINFLKGGVVYSDAITVVSKKYSEEIQHTYVFGKGLEGVLRQRKDSIYGIINGIDYNEWDPQEDDNLISTFTHKNLNGKIKCKKDLQKICKLTESKTTPILALIARLDPQKGIDIVKDSFHDIMNLGFQFVLLGEGQKHYYDFFENAMHEYPNRVKVFLDFNEVLPHKIYAGADMFLMPSVFEPCGLSQMISSRYGTVPVVSNVGGLADTIKNYNEKTGKGNGFIMENYSKEALIESLSRALDNYKKPKKWEPLVKQIMTIDFSWNNPGKEYEALYKNLTSNKV